MENIIVSVLEGLAALASDIARFEWKLLFIWCLLMTIDIATGYLRAVRGHSVSSLKMRGGIYKKLLDTLSILAILLMQGVVSQAGMDVPIGPVLIGAFCFKEMTSILENTCVGILPKPVLQWLEAVRLALHIPEEKKSVSEDEKVEDKQE